MTSNITKSYLEKLNHKQLVELCLVLAGTTSIKMEMLSGYRNQLQNIANYLNNDNIVDDLSSEDDAEKAKFIITKGDEIYAKLVALENAITPSIVEDQAFLTKPRKGSVSKYADR